jgi:S-(hydroxymethyl)mycothiol dehydrogenase
MAVQVQGVVARGRVSPSPSRRSWSPTPDPARRWSPCRRAGSATPTCTTARAASTTSSRSCSVTRPPGVVERSGRASPRSHPATTSSSTGGPSAAVPRLPARAAVVLLRHPQRDAEDDAADGTSAPPALGIGAFAEKTLVAAGQCTKVDPAAPPAVAGLLGCGVMAGSARPSTPAASPAGHRGGHRLRRRRRRGDRRRALAGAPDHRGRHRRPKKLEWARHFGATHTVNSARRTPVEAIRELTGGHGADVVIDAVGRPETYGRRSTRATSPAPSCSSACRRRT